MNDNSRKIILFLITLLLLYIPLFLKLDYLPFRMWDESRPAIHAYEMIQSNNYLVTTYEDKADMWYTKPPLLAWLQSITIKVIGFNELAVRLPTALAAFASCLLLICFINLHFGNLLWGCIAAIILSTTAGYVCIHGSRTGDVDVLLTFFLLLYAISAFKLVTSYSPAWIYIFFLGILGAIFSKSIAGCFLLPAVFIYFALNWLSIRKILSSYHFYIALVITLAAVASFYVARENITPGYFQAVLENELLGRYNKVLEGHSHSMFYYFERVGIINHPVILILFIIGSLMGVFNKQKHIKNISIYLLLIIFQFLIVISFSSTKPSWYDIPVYPFMAIIASFGAVTIYKIIQEKINVNEYFTVNFLPPLFLILILFLPYKSIYDVTSKRGEPEYWDEKEFALAYYLRDAVRDKKKNLNGYYLCVSSYHGHLKPYIYLLKEKNQTLYLLDSYNDLKEGSSVLANQDIIINGIEKTYKYQIVDSANYVVEYYIIEKK